MSTPLISASACCTRRCDTPTRNAPVSNLLNTSRSIERQGSPCVDDDRAAPLRIGIGNRQQTFLDPLRQGNVGGHRRRIVEQQRQRFGEIADVRITFVDQPGRVAARLRDPFAQFAGRCDARLRAADLAAGQQTQRPRRIGRLRVAKIRGERGALVERAGALIEFAIQRGETAHQSSSPNCVTKVSVRMPSSLSARTSASVLPCVAMTRFAPVSRTVRSRSGQSA